MTLDPAQDPDRFVKPEVDPAISGRTLPEMLGEGAYEEKRDNLTWLIGLLSVIGFLVLVSLLLSH